MFCPKCGKELADNSVFCDSCGTRVKDIQEKEDISEIRPDNAVAEESVVQAEQITEEKNEGTPQGASSQNTESSAPVDENAPVQKFTLDASDAVGEFALEGALKSMPGQIAGSIPALSAGKVIGNGVKNFISSATALFKDPKKLIPVGITALLWIILNILEVSGVNPLPVKVLSFLTFAEGGLHGGIAGIVGGIIGKGIFAGALTSLIGMITRKKEGQKRSFEEIIKGVFGVDLHSLWPYLAGAGFAFLVYAFISGGAPREAFMAGVSASFLSARAALNKGFLKNFLNSLFGKIRGNATGIANGIIKGMTAGFAASALIGILGISLVLVITGALLLIGGSVMTVLTLTGVLKIGKEAAS